MAQNPAHVIACTSSAIVSGSSSREGSNLRLIAYNRTDFLDTIIFFANWTHYFIESDYLKSGSDMLLMQLASGFSVG